MKHRSQSGPFAASFMVAAMLAGLMMPGSASAYSFKPTPAEWAMWPDYCKARYVQTSVGRKSQYHGMVPAAAKQTAERRIGKDAFTDVHHYCASLVYVQRAGVASSGQERKYLLKMAEGDCNYSLKRTPPSSPIYREIANHCQRAGAMRASAI